MSRSDERKLPLIIYACDRPFLDDGIVISFVKYPSIASFCNIFHQIFATLQIDSIRGNLFRFIAHVALALIRREYSKWISLTGHCGVNPWLIVNRINGIITIRYKAPRNLWRSQNTESETNTDMWRKLLTDNLVFPLWKRNSNCLLLQTVRANTAKDNWFVDNGRNRRSPLKPNQNPFSSDFWYVVWNQKK